MALASSFREIVDALPADWTDIELDLRLADEDRYIDASIPMTQINAQPYSQADWHFRINVAHEFGHGAPAETVTAGRSDLHFVREGLGHLGRFPAEAGLGSAEMAKSGGGFENRLS